MKKADMMISLAASLGVGAAAFYTMSKSSQPLNTAIQTVQPMLSNMANNESSMNMTSNKNNTDSSSMLQSGNNNQSSGSYSHQDQTQTMGPFGMS